MSCTPVRKRTRREHRYSQDAVDTHPDSLVDWSAEDTTSVLRENQKTVLETKALMDQLRPELERELNLDTEKSWCHLQTTWQFDACHLPRVYAQQRTPIHIPSLFVFISTVHNLLKSTGCVSGSVHINQLFAKYRRQDDTAIGFINTVAKPRCYRLRVTGGGQVVLVVRCLKQMELDYEYVEMTPMSVFNVDRFELNRSYILTKHFREQFISGRITGIYVRDVTQHPGPIKPSATDAVAAGKAFDTFFPKISQPTTLARQFDPPPTNADHIDLSGTRRVSVGVATISTGVSQVGTCALDPTWTPITPYFLLRAGSFSSPIFPLVGALPGASQVDHMWTSLHSAIGRPKHGAPPSVMDWVLDRCISHAKSEWKSTKHAATLDHITKLKILCVAWRLLQVALVDSPTLYACMIRSFCYSAQRKTLWYCTQTSISGVPIRTMAATHPDDQCIGVVIAWAVECKRQNKVVSLSTKNSAWISSNHAIPFTILDESWSMPKMHLGPSIQTE